MTYTMSLIIEISSRAGRFRLSQGKWKKVGGELGVEVTSIRVLCISLCRERESSLEFYRRKKTLLGRKLWGRQHCFRTLSPFPCGFVELETMWGFLFFFHSLGV